MLEPYAQQELLKLIFAGIIGMIPWIWIALAPDPRKKVQRREAPVRTVSEVSSD